MNRQAARRNVLHTARPRKTTLESTTLARACSIAALRAELAQTLQKPAKRTERIRPAALRRTRCADDGLLLLNRIAMTASNTLSARFAAPVVTQAINCFSLKIVVS